MSFINTFHQNFWRKKKVLITGHNGFKGSWLTLWLRNLGSEVHGISNLPPSDPNMFESLGIENKIESFQKSPLLWPIKIGAVYSAA